MNKTIILFYIFMLSASFLGGWYYATRHSRAPDAKGCQNTDLTHDTLIVRDTVLIVAPMVATVRPGRRIGLPIAENVTDSVTDSTSTVIGITPDSVFITGETVVYSDSTFRAVVSGIMPRIDSVEIYPAATTITRTITKPAQRFSLGITAGITATPRGVSPGITIGLTYRLM